MLFDVLIFLLVLSLLVFFHEAGHFIAAKACGVYCDRFSLGMPPRLFGIRIGETDYCIGALPIGGYVKMAGQEDVPKDEEERQKEYQHVPPERWLQNKPIWQRAIVFAAGPLMNLVLAVLLYGAVVALGENVPESKFETRIGYIDPESPATRAPLYELVPGQDARIDETRQPDATGWRTGDRIISVNGERVNSIEDVAISAVLSGGAVTTVELERETEDGTKVRYISPVRAEILPGDKHPRFGITAFKPARVGKLLEGMPAATSGLQEGDLVVRLNGSPIDALTFSDFVTKSSPDDELVLDVLRGNELRVVRLKPTLMGRFLGVFFDPPLETMDEQEKQEQPRVIAVASQPDANPVSSPTDEKDQLQDGSRGDREMKLRRGDVILEVDGKPATVGLLREIAMSRPDATLQVKVRRPSVLFGLIQKPSVETFEVSLTPVGILGIVWKEDTIFYRTPPSQVIPESLRRSKQALDRTVRTFALLLRGRLSVRDLGGPVMIYRATTEAARQGWSWLVEITAFISINLCVFNLLPFPVLDGGHLLFLGIEGVFRKPVNMRVAEVIQQIGLVLILGLILFVTFNDISRWVSDLMP